MDDLVNNTLHVNVNAAEVLLDNENTDRFGNNCYESDKFIRFQYTVSIHELDWLIYLTIGRRFSTRCKHRIDRFQHDGHLLRRQAF